jgi:hypothetical protein
LVGVRHPSRKHQPVVIRGVGVSDRAVSLDRVAFVEVLPHLHVALFQRHHVAFRAGLANGLERLGDLNLLGAPR